MQHVQQHCVLPATDINLPTLLPHLNNAADDDVADLANVPGTQRPHRDQLVDSLDDACDRCNEGAVVANHRAMPSQKSWFDWDRFSRCHHR